MDALVLCGGVVVLVCSFAAWVLLSLAVVLGRWRYDRHADMSTSPAAAKAGGLRCDLRGVPVVGHGIGGTSPGTSPLGALMAKQRD